MPAKPGVPWTTKPTREYFESLIGEYLRLKGTGLVSAFMNRVRAWFFARYKDQADEIADRDPVPEGEEPTYDVYPDYASWRKARLGGIKYWFTNHTKTKGAGAPVISINLGGGNGGSSGTRTLSNEQVYSKMFYPERVKGDAEAEIERIGATGRQKMAVRARITRENFEKESGEVKAEVNNKRQEMERQRREQEEVFKLLRDPTRGQLQYEELARVQKCIPQILEMFFDDLHAKTGWCFYIQGGGPQVENTNAPIKYTSYSVGYLNGKVDFETWRKDEGVWKEHWKPFTTFVHLLFPETERLKRAIHIDENVIVDKGALGGSGRLSGKLKFADSLVLEPTEAGRTEDGISVSGPDTEAIAGASKGRAAEVSEKGKSASIPNQEKGGNQGPGQSPSDASQGGGDGATSSATQGNNPTSEPGKEPEKTVKSKRKAKAKAKPKAKAKAKEQVDHIGGEAGGVDADDVEKPRDETVPPTPTPNITQNPFAPPPILDQWAGMGSTMDLHLEERHLPQNGHQGGPLYGELHGPSPVMLSGGGSGGEFGRVYGYGAGYRQESSGGYDARYQGGFGGELSASEVYPGFGTGCGAFGMQGTAMDYGMDEGMLRLAGFNVLGGEGNVAEMNTCAAMGNSMGVLGVAVPDGLNRPPPPLLQETYLPPPASVVHPDFQVNRGFRAGGEVPNPHVDATNRGVGSGEGRRGSGASEVPEGDVAGDEPAGDGLMGVHDKEGGGETGEEGGLMGPPAIGGAENSIEGGTGGDGLRAPGEGDREEEHLGERNPRKRAVSITKPAEDRGKRARTARKPEWIDEAKKHLLFGVDDPLWYRVVEQWYQWEVQCSGLGGAMSGKLGGSSACPPVVKKWLEGECQWGVQDQIGIEDRPRFREKWIKWWNAMQPKVRRAGGTGMPLPVDGTMSRAIGTALRKAGEEGFVLLLRALHLWAPRDGKDGEWGEAVKDVFDCLEALHLRG